MKEEALNTVLSLQNVPFLSRTQEEKLRIKELGPDHPDVAIKQQTKDRGRNYTRSFSRSWYEKKDWLTGCPQIGAMFCFPCLLFQMPDTDKAWVFTGITDLKHFSEKAKKHEQTRTHMENAMRLEVLGSAKIAAQLDYGYRIGVRRHNEEVDKNRHILSEIIDCIKSNRAFELALRGHDESAHLDNSDIFRGLMDLNAVVREHLQTATVFGTSKTVQNELLDCMLSVLRDEIIHEVNDADFVSIQTDETMDIPTQCQLVTVLRYIDKAQNVQERFFEFVHLQNATADSITTALLEKLSSVVPSDKKAKVISQTYDGASVMRGASGGVQKKVQDVYANAHYVHSYAHQLNLVMQQAMSHIPKVRQFFCDVAGFSGFFSRSPKRIGVLDKIVALRLPATGAVRWNFHSGAVSTVYEHKDDLLQCFENIRDSGEFDSTTVREAGGFVRLLEDETFCFLLVLFHLTTPHVDVLCNKLQRRSVDSVFISKIVQEFTDSMQKIRKSLNGLCDVHWSGLQQQQAKKRRTMGPDELLTIATVVCDIILALAKERFAFTKHLISATLLQGDRFKEYDGQFPEEALNITAEAYPMLNMPKLKTELSLIYSNNEFWYCTSAVALLQLFVGNNLHNVFSETVSLLKILITTPMMTPEAERCFSTLKRIKTFLRNAKSPDRLNALAMLSMEKTLVRDMPDFNKRVIEKFVCLKERRAKFTYKK